MNIVEKHNDLIKIAADYGTPAYIYDESVIIDNCKNLLSMPNAFGLNVRFAMKANSSKAILQLIVQNGLEIDASSLNEARRAVLAGIPASKIMLTTQELPTGVDHTDLQSLILDGMKYNVCSIRQFEAVKEFAKANDVKLSVRIHPGKGSGESASRNTGDKYSCFGVHLENLPHILEESERIGVIFDTVHVHIGSGGNPQDWKENIERELGFVRDFFPYAVKASFGGGLKVGRMPGEEDADVAELGRYAKEMVQKFYEETGRKLITEIEPGTFVMAKAGLLLTKVIDKKSTGKDGFEFIITDGGMETNSRPLLYGSEHPFHIFSKEGELISTEENVTSYDDVSERVIVGRCCETGDAQCLDENGKIKPRNMGNPDIGDFIAIGGCGAYSPALSPNNYNSHVSPSEVLIRADQSVRLIRQKQTLEQILVNEIGL